MSRLLVCYWVCLRFSVGGMVFSNGLTFFSTTSWTFQFRTVAIRTTTNVIKNCRIHAQLFQFLASLNGHFTLKLSWNVQNGMLYNFAEMSPQVHFSFPFISMGPKKTNKCIYLNTLLLFNGIIAETGFLSVTEWNWITSQSNHAKQPVLHPCPNHC